MDRNGLVRLSKLLSLMLRHDPKQFGIVLDAEGYASLNEVVAAIKTRVASVTQEDVIAVVETIEQDKRRFSIADGEIRANYGHSLEEKIQHEIAQPPATLLHGTNEQAIAKITAMGILPMKRQYVHLTTDRQLAERVGGRHGRPVIVEVDAASAHAAGVRFYRANDSFWLAEKIDPKYLKA